MTASKAFILQVTKATWTLREGAHLVHMKDPESEPAKINPNSSDVVSRTYFWLKKQYKKGLLIAVDGDAKNPKFSPGTLMRSLETHDHYVSREVRRIYDAAHANAGHVESNAQVKETYVAAAMALWKDKPNLPAARMARVLSQANSSFLAPRSENTIRKWLRGHGLCKVGRPPKQLNSGDPAFDLEEVLTTLEEN
ncbi:hypothetical protein [Limibacillus halophilus]|uniref:Uncharacterized protein n=1 Tax=Limibacillus halophilus TaxID=1579333 RepID=A0A839SV27_9PROT|nr:hypothetical protein [Limibacillus halophilus]MBB3066651.1 hypothetical protein [Limibacillus halophilus]